MSWVKDLRSAKTGDHSVALYDQEAYNVLSRALERGETATSEPIATIVVNYAGSYSEFTIRFLVAKRTLHITLSSSPSVCRSY